MKYPTRSLNSVKSAVEWIRAEWTELRDGRWYLVRPGELVLATPRQAALLDEAQAIMDMLQNA